MLLIRAKVSGTVQAYWEGWGTTLHSSRYVYTKFHHKTHLNGQHIGKSLGPLARESHCSTTTAAAAATATALQDEVENVAVMFFPLDPKFVI